MPRTRASQKIKEDKSITKLKAKKKELHKGTNVTKTNNKTKKIKNHLETEEFSIRKLNIKELLSHLNHFNTHYGTGVLDGLKDLIEAHPKVLKYNFGEFVHRTKAKQSKPKQSKPSQSTKPVVLNIEKILRLEYFETLQSLLSKGNMEIIDPCMYACLCLARDHIISKEPLICLTTFIACAPKEATKECYKIIPDFLDVLSKVRDDFGPGRTHLVKLKSQITSRVKVLHHLKDYLNEFVKYNIQEYRCLYTETLEDDVSKFSEYTDTMMSLLFETWKEVLWQENLYPNVGSKNNTGTVICEDAASLLKPLLDVISLIWSLVKHFNVTNPSLNIQHALSQKYRLPYLQLFFKAYPYVSNITQLEDSITDPKLVAQNLGICQVFILLNPNINENQKKDFVSVLFYIGKTIDKNTRAEIDDIIIKILHTLFSYETNNWTRTFSVMDDLFNMIVWAHFDEDTSSSFKQQIFNLLCEIGVNDKLVHFQESEAYQYWLKNYLPGVLLEETVAMHTMSIIHKFLFRNNINFDMVARPELLNVIENVPQLVTIPDVDIQSDRWSEYNCISL